MNKLLRMKIKNINAPLHFDSIIAWTMYNDRTREGLIKVSIYVRNFNLRLTKEKIILTKGEEQYG